MEKERVSFQSILENLKHVEDTDSDNLEEMETRNEALLKQLEGLEEQRVLLEQEAKQLDIEARGLDKEESR